MTDQIKPNNIREFGATGDGTTNDAPAVQRALDDNRPVGTNDDLNRPVGTNVDNSPGERDPNRPVGTPGRGYSFDPPAIIPADPLAAAKAQLDLAQAAQAELSGHYSALTSQLAPFAKETGGEELPEATLARLIDELTQRRAAYADEGRRVDALTGNADVARGTNAGVAYGTGLPGLSRIDHAQAAALHERRTNDPGSLTEEEARQLADFERLGHVDDQRIGTGQTSGSMPVLSQAERQRQVDEDDLERQTRPDARDSKVTQRRSDQ